MLLTHVLSVTSRYSLGLGLFVTIDKKQITRTHKNKNISNGNVHVRYRVHFYITVKTVL